MWNLEEEKIHQQERHRVHSRSEEQYRELLDNAYDLIHSVAPDGTLLYANPAWQETLGYCEEEIVARHGGEVRIDSRPNRGTIFHISIAKELHPLACPPMIRTTTHLPVAGRGVWRPPLPFPPRPAAGNSSPCGSHMLTQPAFIHARHERTRNPHNHGTTRPIGTRPRKSNTPVALLRIILAIPHKKTKTISIIVNQSSYIRGVEKRISDGPGRALPQKTAETVRPMCGGTERQGNLANQNDRCTVAGHRHGNAPRCRFPRRWPDYPHRPP